MGLFGSKKKKQVIGYRYYIGMHMITGHAHTDGCERIRVGEKTAWAHSSVLKDNITNIVTAWDLSGASYMAQTFTTTSSYTLSHVEFMCWRNWNAYPGTCYVTLRATDVDGKPTGPDLAHGTFDGDAVTEQPASLALAGWDECYFDDPIVLENSTKYALVVTVLPYSTAGFGGLNFNADNNEDNYTGGDGYVSNDGGVTWSFLGGEGDLLFKCYTKDGQAPNGTITIASDSLFGGNRKDGGVSGNVDLMFGASDQVQNSYLVARLDADIPAYRGVFGAVLNQVYIGTGAYLKPWSFLNKRVSKQIDGSIQWYKEKAVINPRTVDGDDLNAIHILRECLIAPEWGLGWSADDIDDNSFREAANILYDENFGLSMIWDQVEPMEDFVDEILNYIAGILYQDLSSGKWVISLTRDNDYATAYDGYTTGDNNQGIMNAGVSGGRHFGQSFTPTRTYTAASCKIKCYKSTGATFAVRCEIQGTDVNGDPDGIVHAQGTINAADVNEVAGTSWVSCIFNKKAVLTIGTQYQLVVHGGYQGIGTLYWRVDTYGKYASENYKVSNDSGSTWTDVLTSDFMFEIFAGGQLAEFDESAITEIEDFSRTAYGEVTNLVTVKFWDKLNHKTRSTEDRDIALISKQNGNIIERILNYQGICNEDLANAVAARELKLASQMLAGVRLKCTRALSHLKPNDVFLFSWPDLDITQMALRVLNVDYGSLHNNRVILTCAEDEFGAAATIYGAVPSTEMAEPISDAVDVINRQIIELPYWSLVNDILESKDLVDALDADYTRMAIVAAKPVDDAFDYDLFTRFSASYEYIDIGQGNTLFCPAGILTDGLAQGAEDVDITMATSTDLDNVTVGSFAIIGSEYVLVNAVNTTTGVVNISRGVLDTTPVQHSAGTVIYFAGLHYSSVADEFTSGDAPDAKLLTRTGNGSLDIDDATVLSASAFDSRATRPYPPGNIKFNGVAYPSYFSSGAYSNQVQVTWNARDRGHETQLNSFVKQNQSNNYGPEASSTITIKIYGEDGITLGRTVTGETAGPYNYTESFEISDFGSLQKQLTFVIYSVRDGYNSWNDGHSITIKRSLQGTVAAVSGGAGRLSGWLEGVITAISGAAGDLDVIPLYRGRVDAVSNVDGELNIQPQLLGSVSAESGLTGDIDLLPDPADLLDFYITGMSASENVEGNTWKAQTFTASDNYDLKHVVLQLYRGVSLPGDITIAIQDVDGVGAPVGPDLATATESGNHLPTDIAGEEFVFHFDTTPSLVNGTKYAIVLKSADNVIYWLNDHAGATYGVGSQYDSADGGSSWLVRIQRDLYFKTFKTPS